MLIDKGMPSKAALVSLFTEFCRSLTDFADQSTHDIQMWIDQNPTLHERVLMLMEA